MRTKANLSKYVIKYYFGKTALVLALLCVIFSPFAMGAVHPNFVSIFTAFALLSLALHLTDRWAQKRQIVISWLGLPIFLGFLFSLSMLIPLPLWLRNFLAPSGTERVEWVKSLLNPEAQAQVLPVLSLDPPETAIRLLQMITAVCIFVVIGDKARRENNRKLIFYFLLFGGLLLFAVAAGHRLADISKIWGIYKTGNTPFFAPMINPNHLASVFGIFSLFCLAGIFESKEKIEKFWFLLGSILCGSGSLLTLSRGGILAFFAIAFAAILFAAIHKLGQTKDVHLRKRGKALPLGVFLVAFLAIGTAFFVSHEAISNELGTLQHDNVATKSLLYKPAWATFKDNWISGIAPGSLSNVFFSHVENSIENHSLLSGQFSVPYFENTLIQTAIDHGLFKGLILFAVAFWLLLVLLKYGSQYFSDKILILILLFVFLADVVDFAFETGAVLWLISLTLALCATRLAYRKSSSHHSNLDARSSKPVLTLNYRPSAIDKHVSFKEKSLVSKKRAYAYLSPLWSLITLAILIISAIIYAPLATSYFTPKLNQGFRKLENAKKMASAHRALAKHPLNSHYAYLLAHTSRVQKKYEAGSMWAKVSTTLRPTHSQAHLEAARTNYIFDNQKQSLYHYRQAWISHPPLGRELINEAIQLFPQLSKLKKILPAQEARFLDVICHELRKKRRLKEAQQCFDQIAHMPHATKSQKQMPTQQAFERNDYQGTLWRARLALGDKNPYGNLAVLMARAIEELEGRPTAFLTVNHWLKSAKNDLPLLWHKFHLAASWKDFDEAWVTLNVLRGLGVTPKRITEEKIRIYNASYQPGNALKLVKELAMQERPNVSRLLQQGRLELRLGFLRQSETTYRKMSFLFPKNKSVEGLGKQIKAALTREKEEKLKSLLLESGTN